MLDADYTITAAMAMLASAGVGATVGVIGLAAFNAKVRDWLEETALRGEWGYRQRELFRMYLALAGAAAILIPLVIIVAAPPAEIFLVGGTGAKSALRWLVISNRGFSDGGERCCSCLVCFSRPTDRHWPGAGDTGSANPS